MQCEMTLISVEQVREACGITAKVIPAHLYGDHIYDKWANLIVSTGINERRIKGELFHDESVQKVLGKAGVLGQFTDEVKYPRTYHLPWSMGQTKDDRQLTDCRMFEDRYVVVTTKLDGENTSMYCNACHARSLDSRNHPSRDYVKNLWSRIAHDIPKGWRICGENMFAVHSIRYSDLEDYFFGFSIWDEKNICLPWEDTIEWFEILGIKPVKVLYSGMFDEKAIRELWSDDMWEHSEGYVVRNADSFTYGGFRQNVAKFVRAGHVNTVKHWMHGKAIEKNGLNKDRQKGDSVQ